MSGHRMTNGWGVSDGPQGDCYRQVEKVVVRGCLVASDSPSLRPDGDLGIDGQTLRGR